MHTARYKVKSYHSDLQTLLVPHQQSGFWYVLRSCLCHTYALHSVLLRPLRDRAWSAVVHTVVNCGVHAGSWMVLVACSPAIIGAYC